mmetsp:Transcript_13270/g.35209  ORF Transcript_13270/g.35209 Transcript_13270/m.35209 type:complete len:405 (-) Transcript_13270:481-1695(-)
MARGPMACPGPGAGCGPAVPGGRGCAPAGGRPAPGPSSTDIARASPGVPAAPPAASPAPPPAHSSKMERSPGVTSSLAARTRPGWPPRCCSSGWADSCADRPPAGTSPTSPAPACRSQGRKGRWMRLRNSSAASVLDSSWRSTLTHFHEPRESYIAPLQNAAMQSCFVASSRPTSTSRTPPLGRSAPAASSMISSGRLRCCSRHSAARRSCSSSTSLDAAGPWASRRASGSAERRPSETAASIASASVKPCRLTNTTAPENVRPGEDAKCASSTATAVLPMPWGPLTTHIRRPPASVSKLRISRITALRPMKSSTRGGRAQAWRASAPCLECSATSSGQKSCADASPSSVASLSSLLRVVALAPRCPKSTNWSALFVSCGFWSTLRTCLALSQEARTDCLEPNA